MLQHLQRVVNLLVLLSEKVLDGTFEPGILDVVRAVRSRGQVPALDLVLTLRTRLHPGQTHLNGVLKGLVVTHLKVQVLDSETCEVEREESEKVSNSKSASERVSD